MEVQQVLCMTGGAGNNSYANNSTLQREALMKTKRQVEETVLDAYGTSFPKRFGIADLGCSSGSNTLLVVYEVIDAISRRCCELNRLSPEFQVFLNDLPGNDFNTIFRSLPGFYDKLREAMEIDTGSCFIAGAPGSFYGRLFPSNSLHFIHSSYSLHWLSRVPKGIQDEMGIWLNKGNIYLAKKSPPSVYGAYLEQFQRDFSLFLKLRSEEIIVGGRMLLIIIGRKSSDPSSDECCTVWELMAQAIRDMVSQGVIEEEKLDSFNLPYYTPSAEELEDVIKTEGSFTLSHLQLNEINWDGSYTDGDKRFVFDNYKRARNIAKTIRAVTESMLANHFGHAIIEDLFQRYEKNVAEQLSREITKPINLVISLSKKG